MINSIPETVLLSIEEELNKINFGKLTLEISIHDKIPKYRVIKEISFIPDKLSSGQIIRKGV